MKLSTVLPIMVTSAKKTADVRSKRSHFGQWQIKASNIITMAGAVLDGTGRGGFSALDGTDYGCTGRDFFNPFAVTVGHPVDSADKAFFIWKKCVQCATGHDADNIQSYNYDKASDSCGKFENFR